MNNTNNKRPPTPYLDQDNNTDIVDQMLNEIDDMDDVDDYYGNEEINDEDKLKLSELMDLYLMNREKLEKTMHIRRTLIEQQEKIKEDLEMYMTKYNLNDLTKGTQNFILDRNYVKKKLKQTDFKNIISDVLNDIEKTNEIFSRMEKMKELVPVTKIKVKNLNKF